MGKKLNEDWQKDQLAMAFQSMESLPGQLSKAMQVYSSSMAEEEKRHNDKERENQKDYDQKKLEAEQTYANAAAKADDALETVKGQIQELDEKMKEEREAFRLEHSNAAMERWPSAYQTEGVLDRLLNKAMRLLWTERNNGPMDDWFCLFPMMKMLNRLLDKVSLRQERAWIEYDSIRQGLLKQENDFNSTSKFMAEVYRDSRVEEAAREFKKKCDDEKETHDDKESEIRTKFQTTIDGLKAERKKKYFDFIREQMPKEKGFAAAQEIPSAVGVGYARFDLTKWEADAAGGKAADYIKKRFDFDCQNECSSVLEFPIGRSFRDPRFNKLIVHDQGSRNQAMDYLRALLMRLFMSVPGGKIRVTMFDPVNTTSNFAMFSSLGDDDERIISSRIRYDAQEMKEQLRLLIAQIDHILQDCLQDEFADIVDYNQRVGKNAEPLQALFVAGFPHHFDQESCELLEQVINGGPRCGIYTFMTVFRPDLEIIPKAEGIQSTLSGMERIEFSTASASTAVLHGQDGEKLRMRPIALPEQKDRSEIFKALKQAIRNAERIIVSYDEVSDNLTQHKERWFQYSTEDGLEIPIGQESAFRQVYLRLGGQQTTQHHALIAGATGAGKSTILHTIILSTLLRYSPEDVQIFLLDFKHGVEANVYAASGLAHFRVISLETEPEFGMAVLEYLEAEKVRRSQCFHEEFHAGIGSFNQLTETGEKVTKMPRILLIVDEFQEMFPDTDPGLAKNAQQKLKQLVKQGRALGIHVILASQTLPGGDKVDYSQIKNRIAFNSDIDAAKLILSPENEEINSLATMEPGMGIFNDGGGVRDCNHRFRGAFFPEEEIVSLLARLRQRQDKVFPDLKAPKPRLLISSIMDNPDNPLNVFVTQGRLLKSQELGCPLYLGEEVALENQFHVVLTSQRAQNLLIVGQSIQRAERICSFAAFSVLMNAVAEADGKGQKDQPVITLFDFRTKRTQMDNNSLTVDDALTKLCEELHHAIRIFGEKSLMSGVQTLEREIGERSFVSRHVVIFMGLNRAKRLVRTSSAYDVPLLETFKKLIRNGSEAGMNFVIWANDPKEFLYYYADVVPEFDYRLVYDLDAKVCDELVPALSIKTTSDNNVISYQTDDDNRKVRIYSNPLKGWFCQLIDRLKHGEEPEEESVFFDPEGEFEED